MNQLPVVTVIRNSEVNFFFNNFPDCCNFVCSLSTFFQRKANYNSNINQPDVMCLIKYILITIADGSTIVAWSYYGL